MAVNPQPSRVAVSAGKVGRLSLFGMLGGLIAYFVLEPQIRIEDGQDYSGDTLSYVLMIGIVVGAAIGTMLIFADELRGVKPLRLIRDLFLGLIVGSLAGVVGTYAAERAFDPFVQTRVLLLVVIGRVIGWAIMGTAAGVCPGIVGGSAVRTRQGAMGGFLGGAIGGLLFDTLAGITSGGSTSRLVGFVVMGLAIGAAVGLIEELRKEYWLTSINGPREGRSYILSKQNTLLGRDEMIDIPLFGDVTVQKRHARIAVDGSGAHLVAEAGVPVLVNGMPTPHAALMDGDVIEIGRHRLSFHARVHSGATRAHTPQLPELNPNLTTALNPAIPNYTTPGVQMLSRLTIVTGPEAGRAYPLTNGAILGRDPRCDYYISMDNHLSRQHARFLLSPQGWLVEDGGSANGVFVNGIRVAQQPLLAGDQIMVGETHLRVD